MSNTSLPYRPCAGVVLMNAQGLVFAGSRIDNPSAWQMPQGGINDGEAPADAALRELTEETGVGPDKVELTAETPDWLTYDLPPELLGKIWKGKYRGQKQKWFMMRFLGDDSDVRIDQPHPEFDRWRWMHTDELIEQIVPFKRDVYQQVFTIFRDRLGPNL